jgi:hypothetical protein
MGIGNFFKNAWSGIKDFGRKAGGAISDFAGGFSRGFKGTIDTLMPIVRMIPGIGQKIDKAVTPLSGAILGASDLVGSVGKAASGTIDHIEAAGKGQSSWQSVGQGIADRISQGKQDYQGVKDQIGRLRGGR